MEQKHRPLYKFKWLSPCPVSGSWFLAVSDGKTRCNDLLLYRTTAKVYRCGNKWHWEYYETPSNPLFKKTGYPKEPTTRSDSDLNKTRQMCLDHVKKHFGVRKTHKVANPSKWVFKLIECKE